LYGRQGFFQYQCVIPLTEAREALREILARIAASGQGSMLAVLKRFGDKTSGGLLSFPRPGITLALDFPNRDSPRWTCWNGWMKSPDRPAAQSIPPRTPG
jgi:hypothetical protein